MPAVISGGARQARSTGLKFFFIQSLARIVTVVVLLSCIKSGTTSTALSVIAGALIIKMGGFPFHAWFVVVGAELPWARLATLTTVQKVIPLFLLARTCPRRGAALVAIGWPFVLAATVTAKCLKKVLILSSVFFLLSLLIARCERG